MNVTREVAELINEVVSLAKERKYEYVTPELLLFVLCRQKDFMKAYENCGGSVRELADNLQIYFEQYMEATDTREPEISLGLSQVLAHAQQTAISSERNMINVAHIVHALWNLQDSYAVYYMSVQGVEEYALLQELAAEDMIEETTEVSEGDELTNEARKEKESDLSSFVPCLNDTLQDVNPLIGREQELERTIQILCRKDKNNPLHLGEPGTGKTAITYGLVQLIKEGKVPESLKGARVYSLDMGSLLAGTQFRGDFEKRLKKVLYEISKEEKPIIYIDEIHNLLGAGATGEGSFDASNMLKPYLTDGHIRFIGATTFEEYKKYFEKSKSLIRRFQNVEIKEPNVEETVQILQGLKGKYEKFHGVRYGKGVLAYAVEMSMKYINERFLPDKAIDLIDEAGAYRKLHPLEQKTQTVGKDVINQIVTNICRVPVETVDRDDTTILRTLDSRIKEQVYGQNEAVEQVVNAVKFSKAGLLEDHKPLASLLFVGPTGVGKTEIAKTLAKELGVKLIRFDMSEYGEKHAVAKLIGSPAGYVGYEEGGLLTEAIRKTPSAVLLLDEIEKAHPDIYHILLQVMDYATLTDNQGRKADFRNVVLIMTSNAGASQIGRMGIGFQSANVTSGIIMEEVKRIFQPEFRNRLNKIVVFHHIDEQMAIQIAKKKLGELATLLSKKNISFTYHESAVEHLKKKGISQEFGAREIDRIIQNEIKPMLVDEILFGKLKKGGSCQLMVKAERFELVVQKR